MANCPRQFLCKDGQNQVRPNILDSLKLEQALRLAKKKVKEESPWDANRIYDDILARFPKNKKAIDGIKSLSDGFISKASKVQDPSQDQIQLLINLYQQGQLQQALDSTKQLLSQFPNSLDLYNIQGAANAGLGQFDSAIVSYKQAIKIKPDYAEAYNNMGAALNDKGDSKAALESYKQALKIKPDFAEAHNNMGVALFDEGDLEAALDSYQQALSFKPDNVESHNNIGNVLKYKGDLEAAIESYSQALKIKPDSQASLANKLHLQSLICDWAGLEQDPDLIGLLGTKKEPVSPWGLLTFEDSPRLHRIRSEIFTVSLYGNIQPLKAAQRPNKKPKKLRIGYFSADFHEHAVAYLLAKILEVHDRDQFEIYGYSIGPAKEDNMRKRITKSLDVFINVKGMSDREIALLARNDKIDIAIDLTGYTKNNRAGIFAYRAAPVQMNYLGYSVTMGANFIDYIIADPVLIPRGNEHYYSEQILRLPHTFMPADNSRKISLRQMSRSEMGLPEEGFVFCCFNNNYKISPRDFDMWMGILVKVEGSVLWLRNSNAWSENNLCMEAEIRGVDPSRLIFAGRVPMEEHLARHKLADLFLDTFAFNAHTTASEALWAGLPIVTKAGKGSAARAAASLLTAVGLPELITQTEKDYETLILQLANHPEQLTQIRQKLMGNRLSTPLFDTELYTKHLEEGYQQAYQRYFDGKLPKAIFVQRWSEPSEA
jgi:protein O-GlcNAc transferase